MKSSLARAGATVMAPGSAGQGFRASEPKPKLPRSARDSREPLGKRPWVLKSTTKTLSGGKSLAGAETVPNWRPNSVPTGAGSATASRRATPGSRTTVAAKELLQAALAKKQATRRCPPRKMQRKTSNASSASSVAPQLSSIHRKPHPLTEIVKFHGFLWDKNIRRLIKETGYNRRELYSMFCRFKALCSLAPAADGIDQNTFRKGMPLLSVEDDLFCKRVFGVLDEDGSGDIEWGEFIEALSALERGTRVQRIEFLFQVYDVDKDGTISIEELYHFFLSSLQVELDDYIREIAWYFVSRVFAEIDENGDGQLTLAEAKDYILNHPEVKDIYLMFGRAMVSDGQAGDDDEDEDDPLRLHVSSTVQRPAGFTFKGRLEDEDALDRQRAGLPPRNSAAERLMRFDDPKYRPPRRSPRVVHSPTRMSPTLPISPELPPSADAAPAAEPAASAPDPQAVPGEMTA